MLTYTNYLRERAKRHHDSMVNIAFTADEFQRCMQKYIRVMTELNNLRRERRCLGKKGTKCVDRELYNIYVCDRQFERRALAQEAGDA